MPLPDFFIVGAMKAGTTTLYRDLLTNPAVFMPLRKEPHNLCHDSVLTPAGRHEYMSLFANARPNQICGEASTGYTKVPDELGVPERALSVVGSHLKIIYLVREPVARIVSHHYHSYVTGLFGPDINDVIQRDPRLLNYTRYAMQVRPWIDLFGRDNVMVLKFEDFVADRLSTSELVCSFLNIQPRPELIETGVVFNKSEHKRRSTGFWHRVVQSGVYRTCVRPLLPLQLKDRLREAALPKAPPPPPPPSISTVRFIYEQLHHDLEELRTLMNKRELWAVPDSIRHTMAE